MLPKPGTMKQWLPSPLQASSQLEKNSIPCGTILVAPCLLGPVLLAWTCGMDVPCPGQGWQSLWGYPRLSPFLCLLTPCHLVPLQSGQFNEDMIPTVGFNMRKITKGNVTIKVRCLLLLLRALGMRGEGEGGWWLCC